MQTAFPQPFICNVTSQEQFVSGIPPPAIMAPFTPMEYGFSPPVIPDMGHQFPVYVKVGENLVVAQGNNHVLPQFVPGIQPVQYVTMQPTMVGAPQVKANSDPLCFPMPDHLQGRHLPMSEVNQMLPPAEARSFLVPRRRSGHRNAAAAPHTGLVGGSINPVRTLRGNCVATRRRSQSCEGNDGDVTSDASSPIKKTAPSPNAITLGSPSCPLGGVGEWTPPDSRTLQKISDVLEYYFSDDCLSKNAYLLKQISMQENGFVSLRRIAALKRMKSLTRDIRTVAYCARLSRKLEMSEDETMIRRIQPLPSNMEAPRFIRTVIAINLPLASPTIESVTSLFASFGDLAQVRVLKPGKPLPSYLKDYTAWVPDLGQSPCALVEFESQDEAQKACREINMNHRKFNTLRVALLKPGARLRRTLYRKYKDDDVNDNPESSQTSDPSPPVNFPPQQTKLHDASQIVINPRNDQTGDYDASGSGSDSDVVDEPKRFGSARVVSDSGFSQSSGDEQTKLRKTNPKRQSRVVSRVDVDSSDSCEVTSPVVRSRRVARSFSTNTILRHPIGPRDNLTKGFEKTSRRCL